MPPSALVLGGGLAGMAAAYSLARAGWNEVTIVERGDELGGLAGTVRHGEYFYPLAYHHILHRDRTLLYFLDAVGALDRVRWRRIRMIFRADGRLYDLRNPLDFLRFPMTLADKARFTRLMARCFRKSDWTDWEGRGGDEFLDGWAGPGVRRAIFEPLCRLKFDLPCAEVSAAWLGARLHFREGSDPLGYVPDTNWTKVLCDGVTRLLIEAGVRIRVRETVTGLRVARGRIHEAELHGGDRIGADVFVSALPAEVYLGLVPEETTDSLARIRYTAVLSAICVTRQPIDPRFYWLNLTSLDCQASGLFRLEALNPTIGAPGDSCLNFVTHVPRRDREIFRRSEDDLMAGYADDFARIFGFELRADWTRLGRLPMYSPVFERGYRNPPLRSSSWSNLYFAGNYRTFPSAATTGTAMRSGLDAAAAILAERGQSDDLVGRVDAFRLRSAPRA